MTTVIAPTWRDLKTTKRRTNIRKRPVLSLPHFERARRHAFIAKPLKLRPGKPGPRFTGYPDEWLMYQAFADSLMMFAHNGRWRGVAPLAYFPCAVVIDYRTSSEEDAEALLGFGWTASRENSLQTDEIYSWRGVNAENFECRRELAVVFSGISYPHFISLVCSRLPRADAPAHVKQRRMSMYDVLASVGDAAEQVGAPKLTLVSKWKPSRQLRAKLADHRCKLTWRPLSGIPQGDIDAVATYHLWHGNERRSRAFLSKVWGRS